MKRKQTRHSENGWFREAAFGMFIHWGVYAIPARGEWVMRQENIPVDEYAPFAERFNPKKFDPHTWAALAKEAGMKYMILTTRHHDGFSLFDSQVSDFTSVKTAAGRDLVKDYADACHQAGLKVGFYYSLDDWRFPCRSPKQDPAVWRDLVAYVHAQVKELMTGYGRVDLLWYDISGCYRDKAGKPPTAADWEAGKLNAMARRLQPGILINDRSGRPEDFDTPEGHIRASAPGRPWEACMTMNNHWGWFADDPLWKPTRQLIHMLTACASGGGNFLLNVGPKPDGTIPAASVKRLKEMGRWLKVNGEAIYGAERSGFNTGTAGCAAERGKRIYVFVHWWPGATLSLPKMEMEIASAHILGSRRRVDLERRGERLLLKHLPEKAPDKLTTTIVLDVKK